MWQTEDVADKTCIALGVTKVTSRSARPMKNALPNHVRRLVNQQGRVGAGLARPKTGAKKDCVDVRTREGIPGAGPYGTTAERSGCAHTKKVDQALV